MGLMYWQILWDKEITEVQEEIDVLNDSIIVAKFILQKKIRKQLIQEHEEKYLNDTENGKLRNALCVKEVQE